MSWSSINRSRCGSPRLPYGAECLARRQGGTQELVDRPFDFRIAAPALLVWLVGAGGARWVGKRLHQHLVS